MALLSAKGSHQEARLNTDSNGTMTGHVKMDAALRAVTALQDHRTGFLDLPPELRVHIYGYIFSPPYDRLKMWPTMFRHGLCKPTGPVDIQILCVSKLVHKEAIPVLGSSVHLLFLNTDGDCWGGPFGFLSNFYPCKLPDATVRNGYFRSAEHKFQAVKAQYMQEAESRLSFPDVGYDSQDALSWLLTSKDEIKACAGFGTVFDHLKESDPEWWASWFPDWEFRVGELLLEGLYHKFQQDKALIRLLIGTGDLELVDVSPPNSNSKRGITHYAAIAMEKAGEDSSNLLGKALMKIRSQLRSDVDCVFSANRSECIAFWARWQVACEAQHTAKPRTKWVQHEWCLKWLRGVMSSKQNHDFPGSDYSRYIVFGKQKKKRASKQ